MLEQNDSPKKAERSPQVPMAKKRSSNSFDVTGNYKMDNKYESNSRNIEDNTSDNSGEASPQKQTRRLSGDHDSIQWITRHIREPQM